MRRNERDFETGSRMVSALLPSGRVSVSAEALLDTSIGDCIFTALPAQTFQSELLSVVSSSASH
jgi:hypothetical protein